MQTIHTTLLVTSKHPELATVAYSKSRVGGWWQRFQQKRRIRRTERALMALSDHTLKDIGIDRSEVGPAARGQR